MRRYVLAAAALGVLSAWGSENLFWSAPQEGASAAEILLTFVAYSLCAAAALAAVLLTGVQGWRAAFLGGAVLGWLVEGVVVDTMYYAFPFQVVWTPLAWHALVTGLAVVGMGRQAGSWPTWRRLLGWVALGLAGGIWAAYWPIERGGMPDAATTAIYLVGLGLLVPLAHVVLDRIHRVPVPATRLLMVAPGLLLLAWLARVLIAPTPVYLALPVLLLLTVATMRRLGDPSPDGLALGGPAGLRRHAAFLLAPVICVLVATALWATAPAGLPVNIPVAVGTMLASVGLFGWLGVRAVLAGRREARDQPQSA